MCALTVTLGADITALKRAMAGATQLVASSARRMGKLTGAGLAGLGKGGRGRHGGPVLHHRGDTEAVLPSEEGVRVRLFPCQSTMTTLPLHHRDGHLFAELAGGWWLVDTGAPSSFGASRELNLAGDRFEIGSEFMGLTAGNLSEHVGVECQGLLGADALGSFDHLFDVAGGTWGVGREELVCPGSTVAMSEFMGIPILTVGIGGEEYRMFFDTGAQVSYFQHDCLTDFPAAGTLTDFYPGFGSFETGTHHVDLVIGGVELRLRCGRLPDLLGATLAMGGTEGIVGNEVFHGRVVGYFPRRGRLVL